LKLSYHWLNDYTNLYSIPFEKVTEKINLSICEIDHIEEYNPLLDKIICVKIVSKEIISDNKIGKYIVTDEINTFQIISADLNIEVNDKVPLALPGTKINDKIIGITEIKNNKSNGMFCSQKDLNISEDNLGVMNLNEFKLRVGDNLKQIEGLTDIILTIDNKSITHRPDLWSHFGFARELAAQLSLDLKFDPFTMHSKFNSDKNSNENLSIIKSNHAHSYKGILIKNINIKNSTFKIKNRLEKCGLRSINNIVDVSNYILLEMGQPTHFFDKSKLGKINLSITEGSKELKINLLDESIISTEDCIVINNNNEPVAIAGVMGGKESSVTDRTTDLFLESAVFLREEVRRSIRTTGIRSEASVRYEKGLNPVTTEATINRTIDLLKENGCENLFHSDIVGFDNQFISNNNINLNFNFIRNKLGSDINDAEITKILNKLNFKVKPNTDSFDIFVPSYRSQYDITIKEDLVEEVGRTLGYSNITLQPVVSAIMPATLNDTRNLERELKKIFSYHLKYNEVYNYSFNSKVDVNFEGNDDLSLEIKNSMPGEYQFLRTSLYPGLIQNIITNKDRFDVIKIYEFGRAYFKEKVGLGREEKYLAFSEYYSLTDTKLESEQKLLKFRENILYLLKKLNIHNITMEDNNKNYFHPTSGNSIIVNGNILAEVGILHPGIRSQKGLKKKVYIGKLYIKNILEQYIENKVNYNFKVPSQFPQDSLDISILMVERESTELYAKLIKNKKINEIENIYVTTIYRGESIPVGMKSVTYHLELINFKETFTQVIIKNITDQLIKVAIDSGYQVR